MKRVFYGYAIVVAGFLIQAICVGDMFTYGVFFHKFQEEFGWSRALVSGASSLSFLVMGAGAIIFGTLNDRIGPRMILSVSGVSLGCGYILLSQLHSPWQLYLAYGFLVGVGFSTHDVITLSTITRWFVRYRGLMTGLVKVGTGAGQFLVPMIALALITAVGWRKTYLIIGGTSLAALLILAQMMKRDPESIGLLPDGRARNEKPCNPPARETSLSLAAAVRSRQFWTLCLAEFAIFFCLFTIIVHVVPHAQDQGLPTPVAAAVLSTIGAASILGRIVMGIINDRIGGKRSLIGCFVILISGLVWLQIADRPWMLFAFAAVYGFAHGGFFTVMSPLLAELFGTASHGLLFGMVLFSGTLGGTIGPVLSGHLFDVAGSYRSAFMILTAFALLGLALIMFLQPIRDAGT